MRRPLSKFRIIPTIPEHIEDIMVLENECFSVPWSKNAFIEEITRNMFAVYFSAMVDDKVVGYAGMWKIINEGHITNIAVAPGYRRMGIASSLLCRLMETSISSGITAMTLEVRESNIAALALYKKHGFEIKGKRTKYYSDNGENAMIMWNSKIRPGGQV